MSNSAETEINPILNSDVPVTEGLQDERMQDLEQTRHCPHCSRTVSTSSFLKPNISGESDVKQYYKSCDRCRLNANEFYKKNRERILDKTNLVPCECGMMIVKATLSTHKQRSVTHRRYMSIQHGKVLTKEECIALNKQIKQKYSTPKPDPKEKIVCDCGAEILRISMHNHVKSKKHMYYETLKKITDIEVKLDEVKEDEGIRDEGIRDEKKDEKEEEPDFFYL